MENKNLIVALDVRTMEEVKRLVGTLEDNVVYYKVGMQLFYALGPEVITYLKNRKKKIFVDLKLHDIPHTVAEGLVSLMNMGVDMVDVHAIGGYTMMHDAVTAMKKAAREKGINPPKIVAITVLTSMNQHEWEELGMIRSMQEQVVHFAQLAQKAGLDGVVASPQEAAAIRKACGDDFLIVTPGIRPAGMAKDDQKRIATPEVAVQNGANYLVVGRPIYQADNPAQAAKDILQAINAQDKENSPDDAMHWLGEVTGIDI